MSFEEGDLIYREGDEAQTLFQVASGVVVLTVVGGDGEDQAVGLLVAGDWFGEEFISEEGVYLTSALVLQDTVVNAYGVDTLTTADAPFVLNAVARRCQRVIELSARMLTSSVTVRVAEVLLQLLSSDLSQPGDDGLYVLPITHNHLALMTGVRRERVTRVLNELQAQEVLLRGPTSLVVTDAMRLVAVAEEFSEGEP